MIFNPLNKPIGLENVVDSLPYPSSRTQKQWDAFHLDYITGVGKIVGFKRPAEVQKLTKLERKLFERIFQEYHSQKQLQELFGSYELFFQSLFVNSYGIHHQDDQYADSKSSLEQGLNGPLKEQERNEIKDEIKKIEFIREINLPALLNCCLEEKVKKSKHHFKRDFNFTYQFSAEKKVETRLRPELSSNVWENVFSSHNDCINITVRPNDKGSFDAQFQKYWFASMLHHLHPKIQYLNFRAPSKDVPAPLFRVKLMEALDEKGVKYCIVGGVLGEDFRKVKTKGIEEYVDSCIREFFLANYSKKDRLLYNLNHVPDETKPYNQFIEFIRRKYSLDETKLKVVKEVNGKKCTHHVKVPWESDLIAKISNVDSDGDDKYRGEQYSETFEVNKLKRSLGAFVRLEDGVRGFDISYRKTKKSKHERWIIYSIFGAGAVIALSSIFNYYSVISNQEANTKVYNYYRAYIDRSKDPIVLTGEDSIKRVIIRLTEQKNEDQSTPKSEDEIVSELNKELKQLCDIIEPFDEPELDDGVLRENGAHKKDYIPGGVTSSRILVCPTDMISLIYHLSLCDQRKFIQGDERFELLQINLSDILKANSVLAEGPAHFGLNIPYLYEPKLARNYAPMVEILMKDGKQHILSGTGRLSFPGRAVIVPDIVRLINEYVSLEK